MKQHKPSRTALKVALCLLTLDTDPILSRIIPAGLVEATAELLVQSGAARSKTVRQCRHPRMMKVYQWFDWLLPGQFRAFADRKQFFEEQVRTAIGEGTSQVLVLGAGYDTLSWRLAPDFPHVRFFEIDHPATADLKVRGIEAMGMRGNQYLISEDLSQKRLTDVLSDHTDWDPAATTIILAEGLVMYLPPSAVEDLFLQCAAMTGHGSRFTFSYIPTDSSGRLALGKWTGLLLWMQEKTGEPMLWGSRFEELPEFLKKTGWTQELANDFNNRKFGVEHYVSARR